MELIFASNNQHKVDEIQSIISEIGIKVITLKEAGIDIDPDEIGLTFQVNALIKANVIYEISQKNCFADDSGLIIPALKNEPGVKSARYAGDHGNHEANMDKVLEKLGNSMDRKAIFKTSICLKLGTETFFFDGELNGRIAFQKIGSQGFGYDPIFIPDGDERTLAQYSSFEKNEISHRKIAVQKMVDFLKTESISSNF